MLGRFVFYPPSPPPSALLIRCRSEMSLIRQEDAVIYYLHIKYSSLQGASASSGRPLTILYSHGNAEDLGSCYETLVVLARAVGVDIVAYDYCGYGFSRAKGQSEPTEERVYADADAVFEELTERLHIEPSRIVLMGRSMGGGPACYLASKHHSVIGGLILLSTFTSCLGAVNCSFLRYLCFRDMFPNEKFLQDVGDCPVLIMHGKNDSVVSFSCAERLLAIVERAQKRLNKGRTVSHYWFKGCNHNDIELVCMNLLGRVLNAFLERVTSYNATRHILPLVG
ncbi:serine peptidase [Trypanosoma conorhini]|uniref:Serine peptidase n=1 Tax=Trypanosoma conorhini TaxID=83891 RepID=A0A422PD16_9TRYP|nr:serine peptidase [Trypanosoma conorhini]RNF15605.1 serine peptidase [Trypanosoma conorhini]